MALITGAGSRIGQASDLSLAAEGYAIGALGHRGDEDLVRKVETNGHHAFLPDADFLSEGQMHAAIETAITAASTIVAGRFINHERLLSLATEKRPQSALSRSPSLTNFSSIAATSGPAMPRDAVIAIPDGNDYLGERLVLGARMISERREGYFNILTSVRLIISMSG